MAVNPAWLTKMLSQVGYHEGSNNDTKYGIYYGLNHEPWCAMSVSWSCDKAGHPLPVMQPGMKNGYAAVSYGIAFAKMHGLWIPSWKAQPGDFICYGWNGPSSSPADMHTGMIVSSGPKGSTGHTVEGNRDDQVGRFTFTVGESVVLGCIDANRLLLGRPKITVKPAGKGKPAAQPRHPDHPHDTGPTAEQAARIKAANRLARRVRKASPGNPKVRAAYRRLRDRLTRALHRGAK